MTRGRQQGFTLFELIAAVLTISIAGAVLLDRLLYYQELAEKAEMEYTVSAVKSALRLRMAELLVAGRAQDYGSLAAENPMDWLEQKPRNYLGILKRGEAGGVEAGNWYFDAQARELVYIVNRDDHLQLAQSGQRQLRWCICKIQNSESKGAYAPADNGTESVAIKLTTPYRWF